MNISKACCYRKNDDQTKSLNRYGFVVDITANKLKLKKLVEECMVLLLSQ